MSDTSFQHSLIQKLTSIDASLARIAHATEVIAKSGDPNYVGLGKSTPDGGEPVLGVIEDLKAQAKGYTPL